MKNKAVFLDKDGTLIPDIPYNVDPATIQLTNGAIDGLALLSSAGYKLVLITNQSGVSRGYFPVESLGAVFSKIEELCNAHHIYFDGLYFCPHHPAGVVKEFAIDCNCRKPRPGMILKAAEDLNIDLSGSWMIGDILNDVEAGNGAGCKTVLIDNGNETEWLMTEMRVPAFRARDLSDAARYILKLSNHEQHENKLVGL